MSLQTRLSDFITAVGTDYKQLRTWITGSNTSTLMGLTTTVKTDLVSAINEVNDKPSGSAPPAASETTAGVVELATLVEVSTGTDATRAVTSEGVRQERVALKAEILGSDVPLALDTLEELAAALADDAAFSVTVTNSLANRVRADTDTQGLTTAQQDNARINIAAAGSVELGDPETDLVALYDTAKA